MLDIKITEDRKTKSGFKGYDIEIIVGDDKIVFECEDKKHARHLMEELKECENIYTC